MDVKKINLKSSFLQIACPSLVLSIVCIAVTTGAAYAEPSQKTLTKETNTARRGQDYRNFDLSKPKSRKCRKACAKDPECKAYTYVKPGVEGPKARCWLTTGVPPAKRDDCCISGVKSGEGVEAKATEEKPVVVPRGTSEEKVEIETSEEKPVQVLSDAECDALAQKPPETSEIFDETCNTKDLGQGVRWTRKAAKAGAKWAQESLDKHREYLLEKGIYYSGTESDLAAVYGVYQTLQKIKKINANLVSQSDIRRAKTCVKGDEAAALQEEPNLDTDELWKMGLKISPLVNMLNERNLGIVREQGWTPQTSEIVRTLLQTVCGRQNRREADRDAKTTPAKDF